MAKITRYNGNLLAPASSAPGTERTVFGDTSQSDDITVNYSADLLRGWGKVGPNDAPSLQWFNAVCYTLGQVLAYLHQMGVAEYNATQEYHTGSVCIYAGGIWVSTSDSNIGNTPGVSDWVAYLDTTSIGVTVQGYDADTTKNDVANTFTANQTISSGTLSLGVDNTTSGVLRAYGASAGSIGGRIDLYPTNDWNIGFSNWSISASYDQLRISAVGGPGNVFTIDESAATANFTGVTLQNNGSNVVVDSDIGVTVQGYDADTAKLDVAANFTAGLQDNGNAVLDSADIGVTVQGYDADTAKLDVAANFTAGLQDNGNAVLDSADIGVTVQGYDADTAKLDVAANFTAGLQDNGNAVLDSADIGVTVQGYDADTTKNDVANTFTANQTISSGTLSLGVDNTTSGVLRAYGASAGSIGGRIDLYPTNDWNIGFSNWSISASYDQLRISAVGGPGNVFTIDESAATANFTGVTLQYGGVEVATVDDIPNRSFRGYVTATTSGLNGSVVMCSTDISNFAEDFDNGNCFNPTDGKFQPTVAGYYFVSASITAQYITGKLQIALTKNASTGIAGDLGEGNSESPPRAGASCSGMVYLNGSTDYVRATISVDDTSWYCESIRTQFSGHFVHA